MLLIEPGDTVLLSDRCKDIHNLCVILHDNLLELLKLDEFEGGINTDISLVGLPEGVDITDTQQLFDWLISCDRIDDLTTILTKHVTCSVLADFLQFVYESLSAAKRCKFSVAYTLARKPFLDELLIFEQLLDDNKDFINRFYLQGNINLYDPSQYKNKKGIVAQVTPKLLFGGLFDEDFIYEMRYDKTAKYGLNWMSNHAVHIVTTDSKYRTADREMNFVFSTKENIDSYAPHYYQNVFILLSYAAAVIDELFFSHFPDSERIKKLRAVKRFIAFTLYSTTVEHDAAGRVDSMLNLISDLLQHECKMCETSLRFTASDFELLLLENTLPCPTCGTNQCMDRKFTAKFMALTQIT